MIFIPLKVATLGLNDLLQLEENPAADMLNLPLCKFKNMSLILAGNFSTVLLADLLVGCSTVPNNK